MHRAFDQVPGRTRQTLPQIPTRQPPQRHLRSALREVFLRVVDDTVGADGPNHFQVPSAANTGHFSTEGLVDLNSDRTDPAGSSGDRTF